MKSKQAKHPPLTIVTVCYNEPNVVETCESIVRQTFQDFEWIVVDGGSATPTLKRLERYRRRMNIFISEPDNGIYHAMNKGARLASGKRINFMNAGDAFYDAEALARVFAHQKPRADIIYGDYLRIQGKKENVWKLPDRITEPFLRTNSLSHQASFIKKELFEKYGYYNEKLQIAADYEKWIEFFLIRKCASRHVPFILSRHYMNGVSAPSSPAHFWERMSAQRALPSHPANRCLFKLFFIKVFFSLETRRINVFAGNRRLFSI